MLSSSGDVLFQNLDTDAYNTVIKNRDQSLHEVDSEQLTTISAARGIDYTLLTSKLMKQGVRVICVRKVDRTEEISYRYSYFVVCLVLALIIAALQIVFTNRWITKPLNKLAKLMKSIAAEDYSVRFRIQGNDEISVVANQFNLMGERLQSLYEQVYQSNLKAREAEILALQAEINPHFMFNTLDNIYWMVNMNKRIEAMQMIRALSESFRITLQRTPSGFVTLKTSIDQVEHYLFIQKMRLQDKLQYVFDVDEDIDRNSLMVLHLVLQPLV